MLHANKSTTGLIRKIEWIMLPCNREPFPKNAANCIRRLICSAIVLPTNFLVFGDQLRIFLQIRLAYAKGKSKVRTAISSTQLPENRVFRFLLRIPGFKKSPICRANLGIQTIHKCQLMLHKCLVRFSCLVCPVIRRQKALIILLFIVQSENIQRTMLYIIGLDP